MKGKAHVRSCDDTVSARRSVAVLLVEGGVVRGESSIKGEERVHWCVWSRERRGEESR